MPFYWVWDIVRQVQLLVYWVAGEHNLADYFTKQHKKKSAYNQEHLSSPHGRRKKVILLYGT